MFVRLIVVGIVVISLNGCINVEPSSVPTPSGPAEVAVSPSPHESREWFDCWDVDTSKTAPSKTTRAEHLVVAFGLYNELNLLQLDLADGRRSLIASNVQNYYRSNPQEIVSPNGRYLWYSTFDPALRSGVGAEVILVYNFADGTSQRVPFPLDVNTVGDTVGWSPNSKCLVLWSSDTAMGYRLSDGVMLAKTITGANFSFDVSTSPDGRWWAWACNGKGGICVSNPQGTVIQGGGLRIPVDIDDASGYPYFRGLPQWSPQGDILAFAYASKSRTIMDTVRLVHVENDRFDEYEDIKAKVLSLQWSPDGHQLLIAGSNLQVYDLATKRTTSLKYPQVSPASIRPAWSFDGKRIVFIGANGSRLYVMSADGASISEIPLPASINDSRSSQAIYYVFWVP